MATDTELRELAEEKEETSPVDEETRPWCECNKACLTRLCCSINIYWKTVILLTVVLVYLFIGGAIFSALERPNEIQNNQAEIDANETYFNLLGTVVDYLVNNSNFTRENATELVRAIGDAVIGASDVSPSNNWEYGSSIFFAITVISTIGYGTIAPVTLGGRIFFIPYAIIGIPIMLVFLTELGKILNNLLDWSTRPLGKKMELFWMKLLVLVVATTVGVILFILIPAVIFAHVSGWTYFEGIYYCFVSLTTVGFGDFVPTSPSKYAGLYRICSGGWIFVGLAFIALVIAQIQEVMSKTGDRMKKLREKLKTFKKRKKSLDEVTSADEMEVQTEPITEEISPKLSDETLLDTTKEQ